MPPDGHERDSYGSCFPNCPECIEQRKKYEARIEHMKKVGKEWADLRAERDRYRAALEWYANHENYDAHRRLQYMAAPAEEDRGRRARRALGVE